MTSPAEIAATLRLPPPTAQQEAIIGAELGPALVIAGAGSGKTETMAARVLWLLANGHVQPSQILGLTFTRKAAGELSARVAERIGQLAATPLFRDQYDPLEAPTIATYNSYANALYRDNAIVLGRESDGTVLGEAAAWQLARSVLVRSEHTALADLDRNLDPIVDAVLALSRAMAENMVEGDGVREFARRFAGLADLPPGGTGNYAETNTYLGVLRQIRTVAALETLTVIAAEYDAEKVRRGLVEYSDQVASALRILQKQPALAAEQREQYRVVLLDEYQDTSVVQTRLLSTLFAGHPVMAVGDPNQSIYGWRGASAENLQAFPEQFGSDRVFPLTTSWRNGVRILDAANVLVEPFLAAARVPVERLEPRPGATDRAVEVRYPETLGEEAEAVATWLKERLAEPGPVDERTGRPRARTAALLLRARKTQPFFLAALRAAGVRYHVLGIGGLMAEPEIADLVSALAVVGDPTAGVELIRLLTGSRWRLGVHDIHALRQVASWVATHDIRQQRLEDDVVTVLRDSVTDADGGSIVDALDFVASAPPDHLALQGISEPGLARMREAGALFQRLRRRTGLDLRDFVAFTVQELGLDLEVGANEARFAELAPLEALFDALDGYVAVDPAANLSGFLSWLRLAEQREDLSPRPEDPEPGTVQVLTIHGAKGLEWDAVAVPRLVLDELPTRPVGGSRGWLRFGELPWSFRGDAADLPVLHWEQLETVKDFEIEAGAFSKRVRAHLDEEERRLAYVAVTRARDDLLLTGSFWSTIQSQRVPSVFLRELGDAGVIESLPIASALPENPFGRSLETMTWPLDPLGDRRPAVEAAAALVRGAEPAFAGPWAEDLELLLAERAARQSATGLVDLPARVPASRFKDFVDEPNEVAISLRRPMPERPYRATQLGTLFHSWVEERYGAGDAVDELDALSTETDIEYVAVDDATLARLKATFERSPWATRRPVEVEREIHLPFLGRTVVCKIDAIYLSDAPPAGAKSHGDDRYEIVDWKTGKGPKDAADRRLKELQLALYRVAFAEWKGIPVDRVDAAFYFVADDEILRPRDLLDRAGLEALWQEHFGALPS